MPSSLAGQTLTLEESLACEITCQEAWLEMHVEYQQMFLPNQDITGRP